MSSTLRGAEDDVLGVNCPILDKYELKQMPLVDNSFFRTSATTMTRPAILDDNWRPYPSSSRITLDQRLRHEANTTLLITGLQFGLVCIANGGAL
ncbi:hypothetical protein ARMGADRAFT_1070999 [Armillaria gallica]|uniref:Uncharacterized protein n=1 Tax=Armillaria gallica TaxID=47427 RepID=A0A2H3EZ38_ARMGA|nr:hypothetical protein ARMGADRAFT_1070999 [Armillaria gallica]